MAFHATPDGLDPAPAWCIPWCPLYDCANNSIFSIGYLFMCSITYCSQDLKSLHNYNRTLTNVRSHINRWVSMLVNNEVGKATDGVRWVSMLVNGEFAQYRSSEGLMGGWLQRSLVPAQQQSTNFTHTTSTTEQRRRRRRRWIAIGKTS